MDTFVIHTAAAHQATPAAVRLHSDPRARNHALGLGRKCEYVEIFHSHTHPEDPELRIFDVTYRLL